jgi:chromosome segregation ATPase
MIEVPLWALGVGSIISTALGVMLPKAIAALRLWFRERRLDRGEARHAAESATATIYELLRESRTEVRELGNRLEHATLVATELRGENAKLRAEATRFSNELANARTQIARLEAALEQKDAVIGELRKASADELVEAVRREMREPPAG